LANSTWSKGDEWGNAVARAGRLVWRVGLWVGLAILGLGLTVAQSKTVCKVPIATSAPHVSGTPPKSTTEISIWKTITLGEYPNLASLRLAIENSPCSIGLGDSVEEAIGRPTFLFSKTKLELDLGVVSGADLGFSEDGGSLLDIYNRAVAIGLELCPPDLGPTLRLNYLDQSRGEFLHIAMRPVALYNREVVDFSLGNDGNTLLLLSGDGRPETVLPGAVRFIFVRPRPNTIARDNAPANSGDFAKR
jgi:hypothetical protein